MTAKNSTPDIEKALVEVFARAQADDAFRQQVLNDPGSAIGDAMGITLPETFNETFFASKADLPLRATTREGELDDAELEQVSGGWVGVVVGIVAAVVIVVADNYGCLKEGWDAARAD